MPRFQEQSTRPQGTAVYDLDIIKIKFVVVFHTVLRQKRILVTCEGGSFMFFCSLTSASHIKFPETHVHVLNNHGYFRKEKGFIEINLTCNNFCIYYKILDSDWFFRHASTCHIINY